MFDLFSPNIIDVSILYSSTFIRDAKEINQILIQYFEISGQTININKSGLIFSGNTPLALS